MAAASKPPNNQASQEKRDEMRAAIMKGAENGWSQPMIAKSLGVSTNTVGNWIKKLGINWTKLKQSFKIAKVAKKQKPKKKKPPKPQRTQVKESTSNPQKSPSAAEMALQIEQMKSEQQQINDLVSLAPERFRGAFKLLVIDYFQTRDVKKWEAIIKFAKEVNQFDVQTRKENIIPYVRPAWLSERQTKITDTIVALEKHVSIDGDKQTGKSSAVGVGFFELMIQRPCRVFFMASKKETAMQIIEKILAEKRFEYIQDHIHQQFKEHIVFKTNTGEYSHLFIIDTTEAAVKGVTGYLWVDDIDTIIKNHHETVITKAITIARANPDLKIVFTSNMGKGAYIMLMEVFKKWPDMIETIQLTREHASHIDELSDEFLYDVMTAVAGKGEAEAMLRHTYVADGDCFDPISLRDAFETYPVLMTRRPIPTGIGMTVDPSGTGHPFGWFVGALAEQNDGLVGWEIESGELQMGEVDFTRDKHSFESIVEFLDQKARELNVQWIVIEPNTTGPALGLALKARGHKVIMSVWGGDGKINSRDNYIAVFRDLLDSRAISLSNREQLHGQLLIYNPEAKKDKMKGDVADAAIITFWHLVGGYKYLQSKYQQSRVAAVPQPHKRSVGLF